MKRINITPKITYFLFGVSVGLLIGIGFFIFKIDEYLDKFNLFKSTRDTVIAVPVNISQKQDKPTSDKKPGSTVIKSNSVVDSSEKLKEILIDSLSQIDSITDADFSRTNEEQLVVKKDELLESRQVDITVVSVKKVTGVDSILEKESGLKEKSLKKNSPVVVEYWQSPINYKGYKMQKNKLILFGYPHNENIKIFAVDDNYYIKLGNSFYKADFYQDFKQFESVKDQNILAKLK